MITRARLWNDNRTSLFGGLPTVAVLLACVGTIHAAEPQNVRVPVDEVEAQTLASMTDIPETTPVEAPANSEGAAAVDAENPGVHVSDYMNVDIFVNNEDLANVLQMLSLQSRRNIIASSNVSASVTANLYGVTFKEALDSILHVNGYNYIEKGNFIYVYTKEEYDQIKLATTNKVPKIITLNYLNANDAAEFATPLLSDQGQIKTNGDAGEFSLPEDTPTGGEEFPHTATLMVFDFPDHVEQIEKLIAQLDTKPMQVLVEATILQTSLNEANAFGIDFALLADVEFTDFFNLGGPLGSALALGQTGDDKVAPGDNRGTAVNSTPGNFGGPGTFKAAIIHDDFGIFLRALDEVSDVKVLSNPKILALNRQPARVLVGRKLGYLNTTATETSTTQTVEFLDTGTQLSFRPFISKDGMVRMELKPRVSEGLIREASDATGAAVTIPDEITQEITTNVIVQDGQTIVLGGLFKETTTLSRKQVPVLGDIPIVGMAFRGHDDSTDRAEIMFLIKPTIVNETILGEAGDRGLAYVERVRAGSREGLLPFSRDRQTAKLNVEAERLASEGKLNAAMHKLRRSLELNPHQPDALQLRERLFNEKDFWPSRSVMDRVVNSELEKTYSVNDRPGLSPILYPTPNVETASTESFDSVQSNAAVSVAGVDQPFEDTMTVEVEGDVQVFEDPAFESEVEMLPPSGENNSMESSTQPQPESSMTTGDSQSFNAGSWDQPIALEPATMSTQENPVLTWTAQPNDGASGYRYPVIAGLPWMLWWDAEFPVNNANGPLDTGTLTGVDTTNE